MECHSCHQKEHFARECLNSSSASNWKRTVPAITVDVGPGKGVAGEI